MTRWLALACALGFVLLSAPAQADDYRDCQQEEDVALSLQACSKVVKAEPSNASALFSRANAYWKKNDYQRAYADYTKAISLNATYAEAINGRGNILRLVKNYDAALTDLNEALRLKPDFALAYANRALVYVERGNAPAALTDFQRAARLMPAAEPSRPKVLAYIAKLGGSPPEAAQQVVQAPAVVAPAASPGKRVALVIGESRYRSVPALANPSADAELIGAALRQAGIADVTVAVDLDRDAMVAALKSFGTKADDADWAVIYYAGHGIEAAGTNYLIPIDARLERERDILGEAISLDQVLGAVEGARQLRLVVLDACRNNPFEATMRRNGAARSVGRGLSRVEPTGATLVAFAAKEGTTAADGDSRNSPFAASFAKHVLEPGVEINMLFRYVRQDVLEGTGKAQEPFVYGSLPPTPFFFVSAR